MKMKTTYSEKVKIKPWIGKNYNNSKPKLLLLGMSLYDHTESKDIVSEYINEVKDGKNYSFFTKVMNVFNDENHWDKIAEDHYEINRDRFWDDIAMYEYIQERMDFPKQKTPKEYWENAKAPFFEVLEFLAPDIVVCLGFLTYYNLPDTGKEGPAVTFNGITMESWIYTLMNGKEVKVCKVQHPSSVGFKQDDWMQIFTEYLAKHV